MDLHTQWGHRWLNPKAEARKSELEGTGVFAREKISKGEPIIVFGGIIVPVTELDEYKKHMGQVGLQISDEFFIVPTSREEIEKYGVINHSCEPNIGFDGNLLRAMRDIEVDEECCADYSFNYAILDPFDCNCGKSSCRKRITGDDWQIKELQEKYKDYFTDFIKKKFAK